MTVRCPKCGLEFINVMGLLAHNKQIHTRVCFHCGRIMTPTELNKHLLNLFVKLITKKKNYIQLQNEIVKQRILLACYLQGGTKFRKLVRKYFPQTYENIYHALTHNYDLTYLVAPTQTT